MCVYTGVSMQQYVILQWQQQLFQVLQLFEKHCRDIQCTPLKKKEKTKSPNICCCYLTLFLKLASQSSPAKNTG